MHKAHEDRKREKALSVQNSYQKTTRIREHNSE